jgi:hypothetical protein
MMFERADRSTILDGIAFSLHWNGGNLNETADPLPMRKAKGSAQTWRGRRCPRAGLLS